MTFSSFHLDPKLLKALTEIGYQNPTPIQLEAIPVLLKGGDLIASAQTGTGKTAAFALPILEQLEPGSKSPQALIITPTRELAEQIDQNIKAYAKHLKVKCQAIYGGVNIKPQTTALHKGVDIVVATPGRLLDHLSQKNLKLDQVKYFVLDEADRMLDMGFLPDIQRIIKYLPKQRQSLLFSATMPPEIQELAQSITIKPQMIQISPHKTTAETVDQKVYKIEKGHKLNLLSHLLSSQSMYAVIVFTRTRHGADRIARQLSKKGFPTDRIHADRSQNQRQQALDGFKQGKYQVLVATDIAARGIDIEQVTHVINFDTPTHAEDYVHRIGRTGRAEASGEAYTFTSPEEEKYLKEIEKLIKQRLPIVDPALYQDEIKPTVNSETTLVAETKQKTSSSPNRGRQSAKKPDAQKKPEIQKRQEAEVKANPGRTARPRPARAESPQVRAIKPVQAKAPAKAAPVKAAPVKVSKELAKPTVQVRNSRSPRDLEQDTIRKPAPQQVARKASAPQPKPIQSQAQSRSQGGNQSQGQNRSQSSTQSRTQSGNQGGAQSGNQGSYSQKPVLRVNKRSQGSFPLGGDVDYIDLDNEAQPQNLDANQMSYPRNPVYQPWKNGSGGRTPGRTGTGRNNPAQRSSRPSRSR